MHLESFAVHLHSQGVDAEESAALEDSDINLERLMVMEASDASVCQAANSAKNDNFDDQSHNATVMTLKNSASEGTKRRKPTCR